MNISTAFAQAALDAGKVLFNGGTLEFRTGARPANVGAAASGTLLGTATMNATAFGASSTTADVSEATANVITGDTSADASGTIGHVRAKQSGGTALGDLTVGTTGSGADVEFASLSVTAGGQINVTSMKLRLPNLDT